MIVILPTAISSALAALGVLTLAQRHQLHLARHDPVTGLATRLLWTARAERAVSGRTDVIVVMVDGDHAKNVNDAHGHDAGDMLISTLARRLESWAGPDAVVVARLGGDEFSACIRLCPDQDPRRRLAALTEQLSAPVPYGGINLPGGPPSAQS